MYNSNNRKEIQWLTIFFLVATLLQLSTAAANDTNELIFKKFRINWKETAELLPKKEGLQSIVEKLIGRSQYGDAEYVSVALQVTNALNGSIGTSDDIKKEIIPLVEEGWSGKFKDPRNTLQLVADHFQVGILYYEKSIVNKLVYLGNHTYEKNIFLTKFRGLPFVAIGAKKKQSLDETNKNEGQEQEPPQGENMLNHSYQYLFTKDEVFEELLPHSDEVVHMMPMVRFKEKPTMIEDDVVNPLRFLDIKEDEDLVWED